MLAYYGGKSRLVKYIEPLLPATNEVNGFVDLFVGGGSVSDVLSKHYSHGIINDIDLNLIRFYRALKSNADEVKRIILDRRESLTLDGIRGFKNDIFSDNDDLSVAFKYFTLIYTMYSNKPYSTPTSKNLRLFRTRNIDKDFDKISNTLKSIDEIRNDDFHKVMYEGMFYYCDPPYWKVGNNDYYGKNGENHRNFDHNDFFSWISSISMKNKVMISYEDSFEVRELYKDWTLVEIPKKSAYYDAKSKEMKYKITNELLIKNY